LFDESDKGAGCGDSYRVATNAGMRWETVRVERYSGRESGIGEGEVTVPYALVLLKDMLMVTVCRVYAAGSSEMKEREPQNDLKSYREKATGVHCDVFILELMDLFLSHALFRRLSR
jgi:hypothetical protein